MRMPKEVKGILYMMKQSSSLWDVFDISAAFHGLQVVAFAYEVQNTVSIYRINFFWVPVCESKLCFLSSSRKFYKKVLLLRET